MPGTLIPQRSVYGDTGTYCGETFGAQRWDRGDLITGSSYWSTVFIQMLFRTSVSMRKAGCERAPGFDMGILDWSEFPT